MEIITSGKQPGMAGNIKSPPTAPNENDVLPTLLTIDSTLVDPHPAVSVAKCVAAFVALFVAGLVLQIADHFATADTRLYIS